MVAARISRMEHTMPAARPATDSFLVALPGTQKTRRMTIGKGWGQTDDSSSYLGLGPLG